MKKASLVTLLLGIIVTSTFGSYVSSKSRRCRSQCTPNRRCISGFECQPVQRDGCGMIYECIKLKSVVVVDPMERVVDVRKRAFVQETSPVVTLRKGNSIFREGSPNVDELPGAVVGVRNAIVKDKQLSLVRGRIINKLRNRITGQIVNINVGKSLDTGVGITVSSSPIMSTERQLAIERCIQNCLASSGCPKGTTECGSQCQSICLNPQSSVGLLESLVKLRKSAYPVDNMRAMEQKLSGKSIIEQNPIVPTNNLKRVAIGEPALLIDELGQIRVVDASSPEFKNIEKKQVMLDHVDPIIDKKSGTIRESTLLVDNLGQTRFVDRGLKRY